jgi:hypothetical protein
LFCVAHTSLFPTSTFIVQKQVENRPQNEISKDIQKSLISDTESLPLENLSNILNKEISRRAAPDTSVLGCGTVRTNHGSRSCFRMLLHRFSVQLDPSFFDLIEAFSFPPQSSSFGGSKKNSHSEISESGHLISAP